MNVVSAVILVVFATMGAAAFVRWLTDLIFARKKGAVMLVVPVGDRCENAEFLLRSAAHMMGRASGSGDRVICLDCGMDGETKRICEKFCADCSLASLVGREEFLKLTEQRNA